MGQGSTRSLTRQLAIVHRDPPVHDNRTDAGGWKVWLVIGCA